MVIQVNQELCLGCGVCEDACLDEAIRLVDQQAVIDDALCTACEACIEICPNGAITAVYMTAQNPPIAVLPLTESGLVTRQQSAALPDTAVPTRSLVPMFGTALAFLGSEVAPRLVDVLVNALERRLTQSRTTAITTLSTSSRSLTAQSKGKQRQARYRGGYTDNRDHKGRR